MIGLQPIWEIFLYLSGFKQGANGPTSSLQVQKWL